MSLTVGRKCWPLRLLDFA